MLDLDKTTKTPPENCSPIPKCHHPWGHRFVARTQKQTLTPELAASIERLAGSWSVDASDLQEYLPEVYLFDICPRCGTTVKDPNRSA